MESTKNSTANRDIPSFINVFHSVLFGQMADLEAFRETPDNDTVLNPFPSYLPDSHKIDHFNDTSWNHAGGLYNNPDYGYDSVFLNNSLMHDLFEDTGIARTSAEAAETPCHLITSEEAESYENIAFQLELIVQPIFVIIGFSFNTVAINILRR